NSWRACCVLCPLVGEPKGGRCRIRTTGFASQYALQDSVVLALWCFRRRVRKHTRNAQGAVQPYTELYTDCTLQIDCAQTPHRRTRAAYRVDVDGKGAFYGWWRSCRRPGIDDRQFSALACLCGLGQYRAHDG